jgi:large subunit ribosomal protein L17
MRHRIAGRKLKRTASHRNALLANLATSLLRHKRITTTVAKAKEARPLVEKLITRAKNAQAKKDVPAVGVHERRMVGRLVKDRAVIADLFTTVAEKVADRKGGYTRIIRLGQRAGDGAEIAVLELVDFNTGQEKAEKPAAPAKKKGAKSSPRAKKKPAGEKKSKAKAEEAKEVPATAGGAPGGA